MEMANRYVKNQWVRLNSYRDASFGLSLLFTMGLPKSMLCSDGQSPTPVDSQGPCASVVCQYQGRAYIAEVMGQGHKEITKKVKSTFPIVTAFEMDHAI